MSKKPIDELLELREKFDQEKRARLKELKKLMQRMKEAGMWDE